MKYWFYSEGNILGPYEPAEMLALPAFAEESLVCPESATGDNPGDWRAASSIPEIASALSVGTGRMVAAGPLSGAYEYETGFSSSVRYFEDKEPSAGASYGELLDTIDNILGAYKETPEASAKKPIETDYDLAEKFDIRLSRIQEELEAARWEKNLLLEKIRLKDMEERKNRERIQELEARLKGELGRSETSAKELEQVRHLADLKEKAETLKQLEEIKKEELSLKEEEKAPAAKPLPQAAPAAAEPPASREPEAVIEEMVSRLPEPETKTFKSIKPSASLKMESSLHREMKEPEDEAGLTSRKFKSLGQTQPPAYVYGSHHDKPLPGPEAAPAGAFKPEALEPLPQQVGGIVYDFTVVTAKQDVQQFKIETRYETPVQAQPVPVQAAAPAPAPIPQPIPAVKTPTFDIGVQPAPAPAPQPAPQPVFGASVQHGFQFQAAQPPSAAPLKAPEAQTFSPAAQPQPAAAPAAAPADKKGPEAPAEAPDKTQRVPMAVVKGKPEVKAQDKKPRRGGKLAFIAILVIFGSMAAGGLGYFFLGEGVSLSELTMLNLGGKKKAPGLASQLEGKADASQPVLKAEPAGVDVEEAQPEAAQPSAAQPAQPPEQPETQPAATEKPANENIRKSLEIVKNYKLSGGRGTIKSWFANAFLTGAAGGTNEEWTATPLHGDILVVQYRLLRPRQEPMVYQFEVDAAKQDIVRGINNNAMELLDFSGGDKSVSAAPAKKPAKAKAKKPARKSGELAQLPLPDAPPAAPAADETPTGFEDGQAEGSEEVKYLKAQESDEELF